MLHDREHDGNEAVKTFTLHVESSDRCERIDGVVSFSGEDDSGSFGILAGHAPMVTVLKLGLASFRTERDVTGYLAIPGGVLYFHDNALHISTRGYSRGDDYNRISAAVMSRMKTEEENLAGMKQSVRRLEEELLKRLWEMRRRS